jgi:predicted nuclease with TOPRIM domain
MDTEKKPDETTEKPKQGMADAIGDLIVSGATVLAHSAAEAVVGRVKKAAKKRRHAKAIARVMKRAKKSVVSEKTKAKASKKSAPKEALNNLATMALFDH